MLKTKSFESFQDALDSGCIVTEYHKHDENPNYTVHTKRADGTVHAYTNITADHLKAGLGVDNLINSYDSPYKEGAKKSVSFQDCIFLL
jgi:hypothetical protein